MQTTQQIRSAVYRGVDFLHTTNGPHGLQSHVSLDPTFPEERTVPCSEAIELPLPPKIKQRLQTLLTFEPEVFTSALALVFLKELPSQTKDALLQWVQDKRLPHAARYHFFSSFDSIAADTDTTAVALLGLWQNKAISEQDFFEGVHELLRSAATGKVECNGAQTEEHPNSTDKSSQLPRGVFKCYWEDEVSEPTPQRGRKVDAVVVLNVLRTVLVAQRDVGLSLDKTIQLSEKDESGNVLQHAMTVEEIIANNISYLRQHLRSGAVFQGTRYYPSASFFVGLLADLLRTFPKALGTLFEDTQQALLTLAKTSPLQNFPLDNAMQYLALRRLEQCHHLQKERINTLLQTQQSNGGWAASTCFSLGSQPLYFGSSQLTTIFALQALTADV